MNIVRVISYLTNRQTSVRIFGTLSFSYIVKSDVPQGSTVGSLIFSLLSKNESRLIINIFINDIRVSPAIVRFT
jgi:hypothetical protein